MDKESQTMIKYKIELALDVKNKREAKEAISNIFDIKASDILDSELIQRKPLFIYIHKFKKTELTDNVYERLLKTEATIVISDELSMIRSPEILESCLPVETRLKASLIYVLPKIAKAIDSNYEDKNRIELCNSINRLSFGTIINLLDEDLSAKWKKDFVGEKSTLLLAGLINDSNSFDDFKEKLKPYFTRTTVWDAIKSILTTKIDFNIISKSLNKLLILRNKAAHLNEPILEKDIKEAAKHKEHILRYIDNIKEESERSIDAFAESLVYEYIPLEKVLSQYAKMQQNYIDSTIEAAASLSKHTDYSKLMNEILSILKNDNFQEKEHH